VSISRRPEILEKRLQEEFVHMVTHHRETLYTGILIKQYYLKASITIMYKGKA